jgi:hypothetical protein
MIGMHSLECHNFHIRRYGRCPYCATGSRAVPKAVIVERLEVEG